MEIGKWKETLIAGGFAEEWGYICPKCGCTVSEKSGLGFLWKRENQTLNYCPNCGVRLYGYSENNLPKLTDQRMRFDRPNGRVICSIRLKWHGEDFGVSVASSLEDLYLQDYFMREEKE